MTYDGISSRTLKARNYVFEKPVFEHMLGSLVQFARSYGYYRISHEDAPREPFWIEFERAHMYLAIPQWCAVFGTDSNEVHWKNLVPNNENYKNEFRSIILEAGKFDEAEWKDYRKSILNIRDQYISHNVPNIEHVLPSMQVAHNVAEGLYDWLLTQFPATIGDNPPSLIEIFMESQKNAAKLFTELGFYNKKK